MVPPPAASPSRAARHRIGDERLTATLLDLRRAARDLERLRRDEIDSVAREDRPSARNLLHYLAFRQFDLRDIQRELARRGLSSLGRAEAHVLATLDAVIAHLSSTTIAASWSDEESGVPSVSDAAALLERHTVAALGPPTPHGHSRLMVTLPSQAAHDVELVDRLVEEGMDIARINAAHDDPDAWRAMAANVRESAARRGREVRIACDLAGPKLRTGPLPDGPQVVRVRPRRTVDGHVQRPAKVRFVDADLDEAPPGVPPPDPTTTIVPLCDGVLRGASPGDAIGLRDTRSRRREFRITTAWPGVVEAVSDRTSYLITGMPVVRRRDHVEVATGTIGNLPATESFVRLQRGDRLRIVTGRTRGHPARLDGRGNVTEPATISCEVTGVADAVQIGHRVLLDDGEIEAVVTEVHPSDADQESAPSWFETRIVRPDEGKLRAEKGINLPDTDLAIEAVTPDDIATLEAVTPFTDLVALSFVSRRSDLDRVWAELDRLGRPDVGVVLKIEHAAAFRALPRLLLHALRRPPVAVMLARGDLGVEVGFERLAEVQEQVLWLCEAAHIPVIWATQVLESLAKGGLPTRAEVTDAAWASRAECVMLNKGPYIVEAMRFLLDVFDRMGDHQDKRTPMLRRLSVSTGLGDVTMPGRLTD